MRLLVLGGTGFVGRHVVSSAVARGHDVQTFSRGTTEAELPPEVEQLYGDRDANLVMLAAGEWDAVVDCDSYEPDTDRTRAAAELLESRTAWYAYISSVRAYASFLEPASEDTPTLDEPEGEYYGARKAACERVVADVFGERGALIRAGIIVGPGDPLDRYTWWCTRLAAGGTTVAPAPPERPLQLLDVRDLGAWLVGLAERRAGGPFNAAGARSTMGTILDGTNTALGGATEVQWLPEDVLLEHGVTTMYGLPLWVPGAEWRHFLDVRVDRAVATGMTHRPVAETARDTLAWAQTERGDRPWKAGLSPELEARLLAL
jgi:2'-hydroxyisoflavone reductase